MKYLILFLILMIEVFPQTSAPSGYTSNYRFRLWSQGANPSADSLNANWTLADTKIKLAYDSAQAKVNTYGTQTIGGVKTFSDSMNITNDLVANFAYTYSVYLYKGYPLTTDAFGTGVFWNGTDTLATLADLRSGAGTYAPLAGATFTGDVQMNADVRQPANAVTVNSGATINASNKTFLLLETDGAARNLATINGGSDGKIIYLVNSDISYTITIKDAVDNLQIAGDFAMGLYDSMTLIYDATTATWVELSRSNN